MYFVKLILQFPKIFLYLQSQYGNGALAERLGTGLQNLLERFDSARHLQKMPLRALRGVFGFVLLLSCYCGMPQMLDQE